jgi:hypothetical protein
MPSSVVDDPMWRGLLKKKKKKCKMSMLIWNITVVEHPCNDM